MDKNLWSHLLKIIKRCSKKNKIERHTDWSEVKDVAIGKLRLDLTSLKSKSKFCLAFRRVQSLYDFKIF